MIPSRKRDLMIFTSESGDTVTYLSYKVHPTKRDSKSPEAKRPLCTLKS